MVSLQDVSIGNTSLAISSDRVAIDTGTSLIGAPTSAVDAIFAQVPGAIPADDPNRKGYYYVSTAWTVSTDLIVEDWAILTVCGT